MNLRRARVGLVAAVATVTLLLSPIALHGQSPGLRLDQEFAALQAAMAALTQRVASLEALVTTPHPSPTPPPSPPVSALVASVDWTVTGEPGTFTLSDADFNSNG